MKAYTALEDLEQDLGFPAKTLYGLSNNLDKHYRNTFIPKHDGSKRKLSVPDTILKKVQRSISDNILSHYPISRYATAYTSGSSVQKNASLHVGKQKILKLDIDGFFDHIAYSKVKDIVFCKENYSEQIRILLTMLCYYKESLPQGAPTSPAITNIIMCDFDEKIGKYCADNATFLNPEYLVTYLKAACGILSGSPMEERYSIRRTGLYTAQMKLFR